jgi:hypothetical protein
MSSLHIPISMINITPKPKATNFHLNTNFYYSVYAAFFLDLKMAADYLTDSNSIFYNKILINNTIQFV